MNVVLMAAMCPTVLPTSSAALKPCDYASYSASFTNSPMASVFTWKLNEALQPQSSVACN